MSISEQQQVINAQLLAMDCEDRRRIEAGEWKPAPGLFSDTYCEQDLVSARECKRLLHVSLEFTRACNLGCTGCFNYFEDVLKDLKYDQIHNASDARGDLLSHDQLLDVITQAAECGVKSIDLMGGGEPLTYRRFFELVEHSRALGLEVECFTNGTLITEKVAKLFHQHRVVPYVKVYSLNPEVHDRMVNRQGAHERVMRGIEHMKAAGYGSSGAPPMAIESIIVDCNFDEIPDLWCYARDNGFIPYFERFVGCDYGGIPEQLPSPRRLKALWDAILNMDRSKYGYTFPLLPLRIGYTCESPFSSAYIQCDGTVRPCSGTWANLGNVRERSLLEIVRGSPVLKELREIRDEPIGWCANCYYHTAYACGGCRGQATLLNGHIAADDPLCFHIPSNLERIHGGLAVK